MNTQREMSRSFKKNKVVKDKPTFGKKLGNKKFRRKTKSLAKTIKLPKCKGKNCDHSNCDYEDTWLFPEDKSEVINDYDVSDYKIFLNEINSTLLKGKDKKLNK